MSVYINKLQLTSYKNQWTNPVVYYCKLFGAFEFFFKFKAQRNNVFYFHIFILN